MKGSPITEAKQLPSGATVELERTKAIPLKLHAVGDRPRDDARHADGGGHGAHARGPITVMGRAHLGGYKRELVDERGFRRLDG